MNTLHKTVKQQAIALLRSTLAGERGNPWHITKIYVRPHNPAVPETHVVTGFFFFFLHGI